MNRFNVSFINGKHNTPQNVQLPISNDYLKLIFDDQTEPQMVLKKILRVYVRELHNSLVSDPNDGVLKEAIYEENNISISDSTLRTLLSPQLKQMSSRYKVMCVCECCIYTKIIYAPVQSWRDRHLEKLKDQIQNAQNRRSGEK